MLTQPHIRTPFLLFATAKIRSEKTVRVNTPLRLGASNPRHPSDGIRRARPPDWTRSKPCATN